MPFFTKDYKINTHVTVVNNFFLPRIMYNIHVDILTRILVGLTNNGVVSNCQQETDIYTKPLELKIHCTGPWSLIIQIKGIIVNTNMQGYSCIQLHTAVGE